MKAIHLMVPGTFRSAKELSQSNLASIRLRCAVAYNSLSKWGAELSAGEQIPDRARLVIVGKIGANEIDARSPLWINRIESAKKRGAQIYLDYTDHHLGFDSPLSSFYQHAIEFADICVVPSGQMLILLQRFYRGPIRVIADPVEVPILEPRGTRALRYALWFGHASNISYLIKWISDQPEETAFDLIVLTNAQGFNIFSKSKFFTKAKINRSFYEWSVENMIEAAKISDLCLIPSNANDLRKSGVSSNRLLTSLALGLPTAASTLPSYREFSDYFIDIESDSVISAPSSDNLNQMIRKAQRHVLSDYTMQAIGQKWVELVEREI